MDMRREFQKYRTACYGNRRLPPNQEREVEQAFLSGMIVVATECHVGRVDLRKIFNGARRRLMEIGSFPAEDN